jgi:glucose-1-phosphatase
MVYKNIIFDLGGVLLDIDYLRCERAFETLGCTNFREIYSQARQTPLFDDFETGRISQDDFFIRVKELSGLNNISSEEIKNSWNAMLIGFSEEKFQLLKKTKERYKLFLLSNTNETHIEAFKKLIEKVCPINEFESLFERIYYSNTMGLRKPHAECFMKVLEENKLMPAETIFIDDSKQHVEGALQTGLQAHWLELPKKNAEQLLIELGLLT